MLDVCSHAVGVGLVVLVAHASFGSHLLDDLAAQYPACSAPAESAAIFSRRHDDDWTVLFVRRV